VMRFFRGYSEGRVAKIPAFLNTPLDLLGASLLDLLAPLLLEVARSDGPVTAAERGAILVPMLTTMDRTQPWITPESSPPRSFYEDVVGWFQATPNARVAYGSGYQPGLLPGLSMPEVNALQRSGLTNLQVLAAMTENAADACGAD